MRKDIKLPVNLIGISGKSSSGKDTVAFIIQYLVAKHNNIEDKIKSDYKVDKNYKFTYEDFMKGWNRETLSGWQIKKFATPVNDCYKVITGIDYLSLSREEKELHRANFRDFANKTKEVFGEDVWVNALMKQYKLTSHKYKTGIKDSSIEEEVFEEPEYPNWIISDCRFPNEAKAITDRGGIVIRVNREDPLIKIAGGGDLDAEEYVRNKFNLIESKYLHESETSLDDYEFDWVIENDSDIPSLIGKVKEMLTNFKIL